MEYKKPPLTFEKQVDRLASRGLAINDKEYAISILRRISYYRLSAYCIPLQNSKDSFKDGATFEEVYSLYKFDHELRMAIFDSMERIEVSIRTLLTYFLAHEFGAFGYLDKANFHNTFDHGKWLQGVNEEIIRSRETFIKHYTTKYNKTADFPIWMASEILSFGKLSQMYSGLSFKHQKKIAKELSLSNYVLHSWLHTLVYARNICAHHSRLWNRELAIKPTFPNKDKHWNTPFSINHRRSVAIFTIMQYLIKKLGYEYDIKKVLVDLFDSYPNVDINAMGFPKNWQEHEIWK